MEKFKQEWVNIINILTAPSISSSSINVEALQAAVKLNPLDSNAWLQLGLTIRFPNHNEIREKCFVMAIYLNENNADAWLHLGNSTQIGKSEEDLRHSEACYRKALEINPKIRGGWFNLGRIMVDTEQKKICFLKEIENYPNDAPAYKKLIKLVSDNNQKLLYQKKLDEIAEMKKKQRKIFS